MSIKLTKQEKQEQARLVGALREAEAEMERQFAATLSMLGTVCNGTNAAIRARNDVAAQAAAFVKQVHERLDDEFNEKSDGWQEGERGQEARSMIDEWDGIDLAAIGEVQIVEPEIEGTLAADELEALPDEPS